MDTLDGQLSPDDPRAGARARRLTHRDRAILRAVGAGNAEIVVGAESDLFLDGRCCSDQMAAHQLVRAGLIVAAARGEVGQRVAARLSAAGTRLTGDRAVDRLETRAGRADVRRGAPVGVRPSRRVDGTLAAIA